MAKKPDHEHIAEGIRELALPLDELTPDPENARTHPGRNIAAIKRSLARFGQRKPINVRREGMVITAGNGTFEAARQLGWTHIAVVVSDDDRDTARAYGVADNRTAELAEWDAIRLADIIADVDVPGFDAAEVEEIVTAAQGDLDVTKNKTEIGLGDKSAPKRPVAVSVVISVKEVDVIERALEQAMVNGAGTRGAAIVELAKAYLS